MAHDGGWILARVPPWFTFCLLYHPIFFVFPTQAGNGKEGAMAREQNGLCRHALRMARGCANTKAELRLPTRGWPIHRYGAVVVDDVISIEGIRLRACGAEKQPFSAERNEYWLATT